MAKKTAFRRLSKWIPLSGEVHDAAERDDDQFDNSGGSSRTIDGSLADLTKRLNAPEHDVQETETDSDVPIGAEVVLSREDAWLAYCTDLTKAETKGAANFIYDAYFGPDSKHPWTDEDHKNAASIVEKRRKELA